MEAVGLGNRRGRGTAGHEAVAAVCFPYAGGVPGDGSGPPNWWSSGATMTGTETDTYVEDPRWRGAFADIWGNERFRVLVETPAARSTW